MMTVVEKLDRLNDRFLDSMAEISDKVKSIKEGYRQRNLTVDLVKFDDAEVKALNCISSYYDIHKQIIENKPDISELPKLADKAAAAVAEKNSILLKLEYPLIKIHQSEQIKNEKSRREEMEKLQSKLITLYREDPESYLKEVAKSCIYEDVTGKEFAVSEGFKLGSYKMRAGDVVKVLRVNNGPSGETYTFTNYRLPGKKFTLACTFLLARLEVLERVAAA